MMLPPFTLKIITLAVILLGSLVALMCSSSSTSASLAPIVPDVIELKRLAKASSQPAAPAPVGSQSSVKGLAASGLESGAHKASDSMEQLATATRQLRLLPNGGDLASLLELESSLEQQQRGARRFDDGAPPLVPTARDLALAASGGGKLIGDKFVLPSEQERRHAAELLLAASRMVGAQQSLGQKRRPLLSEAHETQGSIEEAKRRRRPMEHRSYYNKIVDGGERATAAASHENNAGLLKLRDQLINSNENYNRWALSSARKLQQRQQRRQLALRQLQLEPRSDAAGVARRFASGRRAKSASKRSEAATRGRQQPKAAQGAEVNNDHADDDDVDDDENGADELDEEKASGKVANRRQSLNTVDEADELDTELDNKEGRRRSASALLGERALLKRGGGFEKGASSGNGGGDDDDGDDEEDIESTVNAMQKFAPGAASRLAAYEGQLAGKRASGQRTRTATASQSADNEANEQSESQLEAATAAAMAAMSSLSPIEQQQAASKQLKRSSSAAAAAATQTGTDLHAAAGHHHGHHPHYYQFVEVPKKKTWKFGFKRGNHKHEISKHEKGHKHKFHTTFKWHAKEKCKKKSKCKSVGKMVWEYKHHKKHHH